MSALQLALLPEPTPTLADDIEREHYPTPVGVARYAVQKLLPGWPHAIRQRILDPGAGTGVWGHAARERWPDSLICGVDLPGVRRARDYNIWRRGDYREVARTWSQRSIRFHVVIGNPPFSLAEAFVRASHDVLVPGGYPVFFLRIAFWGTLGRCNGLWRDFPLYDIVPSARRPSFTGNGKTDKSQEYALFVWRMGAPGRFRLPFDYENPETWGNNDGPDHSVHIFPGFPQWRSDYARPDGP